MKQSERVAVKIRAERDQLHEELRRRMFEIWEVLKNKPHGELVHKLAYYAVAHLAEYEPTVPVDSEGE